MFYQVCIATEKNKFRKIEYILYSIYQDSIIEKKTEYYKIFPQAVYRLNKSEEQLYLSIKDTNCITFRNGNAIMGAVIGEINCFSGINASRDNKLYCFDRQIGNVFDTNSTIVSLGRSTKWEILYDTNFYLVSQKIISGTALINRIERIDSMPKKISSLNPQLTQKCIFVK
jgi:hypothetical protein